MAYRDTEDAQKPHQANYQSQPMGLGQDCEPGQTASPYQTQPIGWAIKQMLHGIPVRRRGWNGWGMSIQIQIPDLHSKMTQPYVYMNTVDGNRVPWLCSQADLLATDWEAATV